MRVTRRKQFKRTLKFFEKNLKFKPPFRVIVDGTFVAHAQKNKVSVKDQLGALLDAAAIPMVTQCIMEELGRFRGLNDGLLKIAENFYVFNCRHEEQRAAAEKRREAERIKSKEAKSSTQAKWHSWDCINCLMHLIDETNSRHFLVATNDKLMMKQLRIRGNIPIVTLDGKIPRLETPSRKAKQDVRRVESEKLEVPKWERVCGQGEEAGNGGKSPKRRRKHKGPNPLSCLKKRNLQEVTKSIKKDKKSRSRRTNSKEPQPES